jgi:hypothetical protein
MAQQQNPILAMLNRGAAPASVPQGGAPSSQSPLGAGLTGGVATGAPMMPAAPIATPATTSLDLPSGLQALIGGGAPAAVNEGALQPIQSGTVASNPQYPVLDFRMQPTYAAGGMVGAGGMPDTTGQMPAAGMKPQGGGRMSKAVMEQHINDMMRRNPQMVQQIQQAIMTGLQNGELTQQELNMGVQLATVAVQNPEMYPQVRNFAIQQGLADEQSLSPQYDEGLLFVILLAARIAQQAMGGQNMIQGGTPQMAEMPMMRSGGLVSDAVALMSASHGMTQSNDNSSAKPVTAGNHGMNGGPVVGPGTGTSDSVPIRVSHGEYVIPAHVVKMKGKEFFDSLLDKYKEA